MVTNRLAASTGGISINIHTNRVSVYVYAIICSMRDVVLTYESALEEAGSRGALETKVRNGDLFKIGRGIYASSEYPDPLVVAHALYPDAVITMDSALASYGMTDVPPRQGAPCNRS